MSESDSSSSGIIDGFVGVGVAVIAILGLTGTHESLLASIGIFATGVALAAMGATVVANYAAGSGGGIGVGLLGGIVAAVLGILAMIDVGRETLLGVAVIVIGASLLLGSRLGASTTASRDSVLATAALQALVGVTGVALGILALSGLEAQTLVLVALLAYACAILIGSAAVTGRMYTLIRA